MAANSNIGPAIRAEYFWSFPLCWINAYVVLTLTNFHGSTLGPSPVRSR